MSLVSALPSKTARGERAGGGVGHCPTSPCQTCAGTLLVSTLPSETAERRGWGWGVEGKKSGAQDPGLIIMVGCAARSPAMHRTVRVFTNLVKQMGLCLLYGGPGCTRASGFGRFTRVGDRGVFEIRIDWSLHLERQALEGCSCTGN